MFSICPWGPNADMNLVLWTEDRKVLYQNLPMPQSLYLRESGKALEEIAAFDSEIKRNNSKFVPLWCLWVLFLLCKGFRNFLNGMKEIVYYVFYFPSYSWILAHLYGSIASLEIIRLLYTSTITWKTHNSAQIASIHCWLQYFLWSSCDIACNSVDYQSFSLLTVCIPSLHTKQTATFFTVINPGGEKDR